MTQEVIRPRPPTGSLVRPIPYEEFLDRYGDGQHVEWVDGEVIHMPAVTNTHADLTLFLAAVFRFLVEARKLGIVRTEPYNMKLALNLPGRSPDVMVILNEHMHRVQEDHLNGPADLVIEVISAGSRGVDWGAKFKEYQRGGVPEYWLLDPERRAANAFCLKDATFEPIAPRGDGTIHSELLSGVWLDPRWIWSKPLPPISDVLKLWGALA